MARPQRSFSEAINEGLLGLGNTGFQFAQATNEKRRTDASVAQSDASTKASQAETKLRESELARALRQDTLEKSLAEATKARMTAPAGVRNNMPSDDEMMFWAQLNKTSPDELRNRLMKGQKELDEQSLINQGKRQTINQDEQLFPDKKKRAGLENDLIRSQISRNYADANRERTGAGQDLAGKADDIPLESKELVKALASKNANKISIANQIQGYLDQFNAAIKNQDKDLALRIANQSLKVLNSPEGADAIGSEEAARLGDALKIKFFNVTEPGPMFGRDLPGFGKQVESTIKGVRSGVEANRAEISRALGGQGIGSSGAQRSRGGADRHSLAMQALEDPEATPEEKAQARKILQASIGASGTF